MNYFLRSCARSFCVLVAITFPFSVYSQIIDPNFYPKLTSNDLGILYTSAIQNDGKLVIAGLFSSANGIPGASIARLMPNGQSDISFGPTGVGGIVYDVASCSDNKTLVAGKFNGIGDSARRGIARLNEDGTVDTTFIEVDLGQGFFVKAISIQTDGKILAAGSFPQQNGLVRLNPDGTIDPSFQNSLPVDAADLTSVVSQADGKFVVAYSEVGQAVRTKIARFNSDGTPDLNFPVIEVIRTDWNNYGDSEVEMMLVQSDGKIVVGGKFSSVAGVSRNQIARINTDGSLDAGFVTSINDTIFCIEQQSDGKLLVGGAFSDVNGVPRRALARLLSDGSLDETHSSEFEDSFAYVRTISTQTDGNIVVGGLFFNISGNIRYSVARLETDGKVDLSFAFALVGSPGAVFPIASRLDGKIFIGGWFVRADGQERRHLALLNVDGSLDTSFRNVGFGDNFSVNDILPLPDGKVLVGGRLFATRNDGQSYLGLVRYNPDGTVDPTFPRDFSSLYSPDVNSLAAQLDGKILVGGDFGSTNTSTRNIVRLNIDGSLDAGFANVLVGTSGDSVSRVAVQSDGKILIGGQFTEVNGVVRNCIARLNVDGTLDQTFQNGMVGIGVSNTRIPYLNLITVQPDGKILIGGDFDTVNSSPRKFLARLNSDGSLDSSFLEGMLGPNTKPFGIEKQSNGSIIVGGNFTSFNGQPRKGIVRLNSNGSIDETFELIFARNGYQVYSIATERNGDLLIGGNFGNVNGISRSGLLRLVNEQGPFDYDGDGKADLSVRRSSDNNWHLRRTADGFTTMTFGIAGDRMVPGDYDGDGKTDVAMFRPSNGVWYIFNSQSQSFSETAWGQDGDLPAPADHDGDGKADLVVFRPSTGTWYTKRSFDNSLSTTVFGTAEDKPVIGDFDGDGKADIGVYRASDNNWYTLRTTEGFWIHTWGQAGDIPVPADYDGDGETDIAIFRPSTGQWYRILSASGFDEKSWGQNGDTPVPADYDGDGKADIGVFRSSNATWYIVGSTTGLIVSEFGATGDIPTQSAFIY